MIKKHLVGIDALVPSTDLGEGRCRHACLVSQENHSHAINFLLRVSRGTVAVEERAFGELGLTLAKGFLWESRA